MIDLVKLANTLEREGLNCVEYAKDGQGSVWVPLDGNAGRGVQVYANGEVWLGGVQLAPNAGLVSELGTDDEGST